MNDTYVTFHGWVGAEVQHRTPKGVSVASLRVAVTPRQKQANGWADGETTWYTVTAWRALADNIKESVHKGDAVIVHGRLRSQTWKPTDGPVSTTMHVEATMVGHDLTRGTSAFVRSQRPERVEEDLAAELNDLIRQTSHDLEPMDSWGAELRADSHGQAEGASGTSTSTQAGGPSTTPTAAGSVGSAA